MTMHATLNRESTDDSDDAYFGADFATIARDIAPAIAPSVTPGGYADRRGPNWIAIAAIVGFHVAALVALVKLDIISIQKPQARNLVVVNLMEPAPPPAAKPKPEKVVDKVAPEVVTPVAIVQTPVPAAPPIQVTTTPPPPRPVQAVAPPPAPAPAPTTVSNLDEKRIAGNPPSYPMESRRKKEQGTVVLRLVIGTNGKVESIAIAQSSGFDRLDRSALDAVKGWRWQPIIQNGEAISVRGILSIPFMLAPKA